MGNRCTAVFLAVALLAQSVSPTQAKAEENENYLPIATMPDEIETEDTFYVGTTSADLDENAKNPYLLKIGRGGLAVGEASVTLKISDATANYGKDYKIRLHSDKRTEADNPEVNKSLLDMISENEVIEDLQLTEEEQTAAEQENLKSLEEDAVEYANKLSEENEEDGIAAPDEEKTEIDEENEEDGIAAIKEGCNVNNPLAQAKETLTGITSDRETVTGTQQSMVDVLSDTGNYLTQLVPGATLKVDFQAGEKSKYVEIIPTDNSESDGDRTFYVTLSEPSEGMTNSSVSESMFTIKDDEPQEDATVSFANTEFVADADSGFVEVVLERTKAMTQMVSVHMTSEAGSAVSGQDFAPVDADVLFPFGITERKLKITVDSQYLEKDSDFTLKITDGSGAVVGENSQTRVVIKADTKAGTDNHSWKSGALWKPSTLYIKDVKPILRPFKVELAAADKLTYCNGSGDTKVEDDRAVVSTLLDSSGGYAVKYDGDKMVIKADNALLGISQLSGVEIVNTNSGKSNSTKIDERFLNGFKRGDRTIQVTLNNDFCTQYRDYIKYDENGDSQMKGNIKLKPVYSYIDSKVTVEQNTEKTASGDTVDCTVKINGTEVNYGTTLMYHMGDTLTFSSSITGSDYTATGMELSFINNNTGRKETNIYSYNDGTYKMIAGRESYTAVPMYSENDNGIVVRVSEADVSKFKASGIFDAAYLKEHGAKSNGYYTIEVVGTEQIQNKVGTSYTLAAEAKSGYIPIWQETNSSKYFMGTTFDYVAKARRTANIVYLYASKSSTKYAAVKGTIYYENLALNNPKAAGEIILPAEGGYLSVAGQYAIADASGAVQTGAFALPGTITKDGKNITLNTVYVRTLAGAAGATEYRDISLKTSGDTTKVADAAGTVRKAYLTQMSFLTIASNMGDNTRFDGVSIKNKNFPTDTAYMNDESTGISATVAEKDGETVKSVNFLIYDRHTNQIKHTIAATKSGSTWTGTYTFKSDGSENTLYAEGDRIYVQMTTDKKATALDNVNDKGNPITSDNELTADAKEILNQTTYAPVNTGYTLVKSGRYEEPTVQALDIGSLQGLSDIPLVNNFNTTLNLGLLSLTAENLYDDRQNVCGTRLKAAIGLDFDKTSFARSANYKKSDDGTDYGVSALTLLTDFGKVKESYKTSAGNIMGAKNLGKTGLASMGAQKWGVYPSVGFYLDFAVAYNTDDTGTVSDSRFVLRCGHLWNAWRQGRPSG